MINKEALWNFELYDSQLTMLSEPNRELISKLPMNFETIIDFGCGSGSSSTRLLREKYKNAAIYGLDSAKNLIEKATETDLDVIWQCFDFSKTLPDIACNLMYFGASLQWVGDHEQVISKCLASLPEHGCLAIQMPATFTQPIYSSIIKISHLNRWKEKLYGKLRVNPLLIDSAYHVLLSKKASRYKIWTTMTHYSSNSIDSIFNLQESTSLRPVCALLDNEEYDLFSSLYKQELERHYKIQDDLFVVPFPRIFIIAIK
jgi:trans-aconitate 2-methyltransferase